MRKCVDEYEGMKYIIRYPAHFKKTDKYPVLFFLHGAGSRGEDICLLESNPFFEITDDFSTFEFITVAPLCHTNTWFDIFEKLQRFVCHCRTFPFVDKERLYLMGASMGGYATWQLAMTMPECFAAIVPICGGGMYWNAARLINVPVWAFHGQKDTTVLIEESQKMVKSVNASGGCAKITIYPEKGHDAWSDTYRNVALYKWLLSNRIRSQNLNFNDQFNDNNLFG